MNMSRVNNKILKVKTLESKQGKYTATAETV